ncbi:phosphonate metabolism protein/1,5-bisphosphokinase (PRPP-forming) PhnN [Starkeya sp. ORNL1]|uniref:phosphonate metabolism protein/1,5-bisphosphokinase (PRPP-forming) PhnN n=1 Tax=Starkeya sp. ORNL1 TaxID=2709380 RepID=UPI001FEDAFA1|nr:phosphonate metabolism protein/1,5-bisphosphokinase (PRPP-forming) PhnN [Starkeya sp. ORNL1]
MPDTQPEASVRSGLLVFVVGPSGAGKDTLLAFAKARLAARSDIVFARRLVNRAPDGTEDHEPFDEAAFEDGIAAERFALAWRANGLCYALGPDVKAALAGGRTVVANGSRAAVAEARARYPNVKLVLITAPPEVLAARIAARGREDANARAGRLAREPALGAAPDLTIMNDGAVEPAGEKLAAFLAGL